VDHPALRALALVLLVLLAGCERPGPNRIERVAGGDASRAPQLMRHYGCGTCHTIPGVPSATGRVGPPLAQFRERAYIGGVVSNNADNLVRWIQDPRALAPRTAMPQTGVSEEDARHIAAYLYSR
jgi:cytochrome c1